MADTSGKVPKYVKKQAAEWLEVAEGRSADYEIDIKEYTAIKGILKIIIHPDTMKDMYKSLEDYQMLFIFAVLCTVRKSDGMRRYTTAVLEIARKNFKTFVSAVLFIILMLKERRFARLFSVAPDYKLSSELRLAVRKIVKSSPLLDKYFKVTRDMVTCKITDIEYTPLAYSNDKMDGKLATAFLADEDGAMGSYPVEAMKSSQITIPNALGIIISTQYPNDDNDFILRVDMVKKKLDGIQPNDRLFGLLYEPDDEIANNWQKDDNVIYQSNPAAHDKPNMLNELFESRNMAVLYENLRENFLCKHCNIKYKGIGTEGYVPIDKVQLCCTEELTSEWWRGRRVYLGVDLSLTEDNTAVSMVTYDPDTDTIYCLPVGFIPADRIEEKTKREGLDYKRCISSRCCIPSGDDIINYADIENYVAELREKFGVEIGALAYDPWNARSSVQKWEALADPIQCVEVKQHSAILHPATKLLKEKIMQGKFAYYPNLLLENNFSNARCTEDTNLNKYVNKKRSAGKVDMVVATINAVYLLIQYEMITRHVGVMVL